VTVQRRFLFWWLNSAYIARETNKTMTTTTSEDFGNHQKNSFYFVFFVRGLWLIMTPGNLKTMINRNVLIK
jgi:hypothetical protein